MNPDFLSLHINTIGEKLALLKQSDPSYQIFGAQTHKYVTNPVMNVDQMDGIVAGLNVKLPEEYIEFICRIGNGGAGPEYGLFSLKESIEKKGRPDLNAPFPHQKSWQPLFGGYDYDELDRAGKLDEYMNSYLSEGSKKEYDLWSDEYRSQSHTSGSFQISDSGCGHETLLIISGPQRGTVWQDSRISDAGIIPIQKSFLDWYEDWLDQSLQKAKGVS